MIANQHPNVAAREQARQPDFAELGQKVEHVIGKEGPVTRVRVKLAPVRSLFLAAGDTESMK